MITYAGVPLPIQTARAAALIERRISPRDLHAFVPNLTSKDRIAWTVQGQDCLDRPVKIGSLFWPKSASNWAVGYFLVDADSLTSIRQVVESSGGSYQAADLVMDDGDSGTITASMWMLPPHPLLGIPELSNLHLLILVDRRYWWWFSDTGVLNLPFPVTATWSSLYASAMTNTGDSLGVDSIPSAYLKPAPGLQVLAARIPPYLDTIAYNVGQDIVIDLDGTAHAYNRTTSQTLLSSNLSTYFWGMAGGSLSLTTDDSADTPGVLPQSVKITFQKLNLSSGTDGTLADPPAASSVTANYVSLGLPAVQTSDKTRCFRGADYATYSGATWTNQTDLQNLVNQFATDWYISQTSPLDVVYAGIVNWQPEGLSDSIEWTYRNDLICTRVQRPPFNDTVEDLYHTTNAGEIVIPTPSSGSGTWVKVTSETPTTITLTGGPTATAYPAQLTSRSTSTGAWTDSTSVWYFPVDGPVPVSGNRYFCQPGGVDNSGVAIWLDDQYATIVLRTNSGIFDSNAHIVQADDDGVFTWSSITSGGKVVIADASPTQRGVVNTTTQAFAGEKIFKKDVTINSGGVVSGLGTVNGVTDFIYIGPNSSTVGAALSSKGLNFTQSGPSFLDYGGFIVSLIDLSEGMVKMQYGISPGDLSGIAPSVVCATPTSGPGSNGYVGIGADYSGGKITIKIGKTGGGWDTVLDGTY